MRRILKQRVSKEEQEALLQEGFRFAAPTKETLILVALYKKAAAGDMNAIREIRALTATEESVNTQGVTIIDNVPDQDS